MEKSEAENECETDRRLCRSSRWTGEQQSEAEEHSLCSPCCLSPSMFLSVYISSFPSLSLCLHVGLFGNV